MNYIKQIKLLWDKSKRHSLGAGEIAMYFYLLEISNVHDWENPVMEPNATLQHAIGVKSFNTLKEIRNRLQQAGLIQFKSRNGSSTVEYCFYDVELRCFPQTSSKNEKVEHQTFSKFEKVAAKVTDEVVDEVAAKVVDEVGGKHLVYNKLKPKPKQLLQVQHGLFFEKLFSEESELDRENICLQIRQLEIKRNWVEIFNAHLHTEGTTHSQYPEWLKHLRSWLARKITDLVKSDAIAVQKQAAKNFLN